MKSLACENRKLFQIETAVVYLVSTPKLFALQNILYIFELAGIKILSNIVFRNSRCYVSCAVSIEIKILICACLVGEYVLVRFTLRLSQSYCSVLPRRGRQLALSFLEIFPLLWLVLSSAIIEFIAKLPSLSPSKGQKGAKDKKDKTNVLVSSTWQQTGFLPADPWIQFVAWGHQTRTFATKCSSDNRMSWKNECENVENGIQEHFMIMRWKVWTRWNLTFHAIFFCLQLVRIFSRLLQLLLVYCCWVRVLLVDCLFILREVVLSF